jgi:hypothetical protein
VGTQDEGQFASHEDEPREKKKTIRYEEDDYEDAPEMEEERRSGRIGHGTFDVGEVITTSWGIYKSQMGLIIGVVIVAGLLLLIPQVCQSMANNLGQILMANGNNRAGLLVVACGYIFLIPYFALMFYLMPGQDDLLLKVCKGEKAEFMDLFRGGRYFWRMTGSSIVFGLMLIAGGCLCVVPAIFVWLIFGYYQYALVDQDAPGIDSLWRAQEASKSNLGGLLLIELAVYGINLLGMMACCLGLIITVPFTRVIYTVAYLRMTDQRVRSVGQ